MNITKNTYYRRQHVTGLGCVLVSIKFGITPEKGVLVIKRLSVNLDDAKVKFDLELHINEVIEGVEEANVKYNGNLQVQEIEIIPNDYPMQGQAKRAALQIAESILTTFNK